MGQRANRDPRLAAEKQGEATLVAALTGEDGAGVLAADGQRIDAPFAGLPKPDAIVLVVPAPAPEPPPGPPAVVGPGR